MKESGERFKHIPRYTETITQISDRKISIKHCVHVIHSISHLIRANESRTTQFINGAKKLEALFVFADHSFLPSGWNKIPMSFGSIWDILHRCNEMLASCEPKWGYEKQYDTFGWEMGTTTKGNAEREMGSFGWKRGVRQKVLEKRQMNKKSIKLKLKSSQRGGVKECGMKLRSAERGGCRSAEWNWTAPMESGSSSAEWHRGEPIQAERSSDGIDGCSSRKRSA